MKKKTVYLISFIILLFLIIAILYIFNRISEETIKIGWIGPLSGDGAIIGIENLNGIKIAIEEVNSQGGINGRKIELITQDDKYDGKEAISAYNELVNVEGINLIFIITYDGFLGLKDRLENDNVILINSLDTSEEFSNLSKNSFAIGIYDESIGFSIAEYLNNKNISDVGLITNIDDAFSLLTKNSFKDRFNGKFNEDEYTFSTKDYRSILTKMNNKKYIVLIGWEETGRIVKQSHELGINATIIGIDTFSSENFRENTGNNYNGVLFTFWQGSENNIKFKQLLEKYKEMNNKDPENVLFMTTGYDSANVLMNVIKDCKENVNCVKEKLREIKDFKGASGNITIDSDGITRSIKETMFTYKNGEIVSLD